MSPTRGVAGHPARILIVDDEVQNRTLLEVMLSPEEFVLMAAASGEQALAMVALQPPDLILLDVLMPGLGGYEVAAKLKSNAATKHIPIIMVTALDDRDARLNGLTAGAEDFLTRPLDSAELCVRVRNLLRLKTASDGALAERDNSMGMVSHDLRNLLNSIVLQASLLSQDAAEPDGGQRAVEGAKRILGFAARMDRLVEDLIDVVSIDASKLALEPARHDVVALLGEAIESCELAATAQGVTIRSETVERTLVTTFDRGRIQQVLDNLLTNALKFTPRDGVIALRAERIEDALRISVSDTGMGIPSDMLELVFERFKQIERQGGGVGLGLYISRCIVESHGGRLWVESKLGQGSTFHFTIPDTAPARDPVPTPPLRKPRVLVIDDDPSMGETLVSCLNRYGFDSTCQRSPRDALVLVESNDFDVIVTDLNMEEMDGLALCERVGVIRPGLPVIVTTGFGNPEARTAALDAGAYDFLAKPIDIDLLRLTLDRAVQSRST